MRARGASCGEQHTAEAIFANRVTLLLASDQSPSAWSCRAGAALPVGEAHGGAPSEDWRPVEKDLQEAGQQGWQLTGNAHRMSGLFWQQLSSRYCTCAWNHVHATFTSLSFQVMGILEDLKQELERQ